MRRVARLNLRALFGDSVQLLRIHNIFLGSVNNEIFEPVFPDGSPVTCFQTLFIGADIIIVPFAVLAGAILPGHARTAGATIEFSGKIVIDLGLFSRAELMIFGNAALHTRK
nr:hypothetical protein [Caproicibacter fermentans]